MSEKKEGWYIFVHKDGDKEFELAHFVADDNEAECGRVPVGPNGVSKMPLEPWLSANPQHIAEIRHCRKCQAAIAIRDGREPMEELHASSENGQARAPQLRARARAKRPASKATR